MITAFFTLYYRFLQKDNYLKFFNKIDNLSDLIAQIKVEDKIKIYAHSRDIIKFQFNNSNPKIDYVFLEEEEPFFDECINEGDRVKIKISERWRDLLGEYIYLVQDRNLQLQLVKDTDLCTFQATDLNELIKNITQKNQIGEKLVTKMFLTDEEVVNGY